MAGDGNRPAITPDLKVGELLEAYPELEETLIAIAPAFAKLRTPVLRRTVARVTSLHQAARVGGVSIGSMINRLREAAGQEALGSPGATEPADSAGDAITGTTSTPAADRSSSQDDRPDWVDSALPGPTLDAREMIEAGNHPLADVMATLNDLPSGALFTLVTPFNPAPLIDKVRERGFRTWTDRLNDEEFRTYMSVSDS